MFWNDPPLIFFGRVWRRLILILLWMFHRTHLWSRLVLDFCLLRVFDYDSICLLVIGLFRLSVSSSFSLWAYTFVGVYPFLLVCLICWRMIVNRSLYDPLYSVVSLVISPLSFLTYLSPFSFFLSLAKVLSILFAF